MFKMVDKRRETEWKEWFSWYRVGLETIGRQAYDDKIVEEVRFEKIERRKLALPNNQEIFIYRKIGSIWNPAPSPTSPKPSA